MNLLESEVEKRNMQGDIHVGSGIKENQYTATISNPLLPLGIQRLRNSRDTHQSKIEVLKLDR